VRGEGATRVASEHELWLAVGHSGESASTRAMVEHVARIGERRPAQLERFLASVGSLVDAGAAAINSGDAAELGRLFDLNQMLLAGLMLSTETLEAMCAEARSRGALGAKLTGSGGGGSVIALAGAARPGDTASVDEARARAEHLVRGWSDRGHTAFVTRIRSSEPPR
jgi:mevalonate kinase